jgi:hypothetical protein
MRSGVQPPSAALLAAVLLPACNDTTTNLPEIPRAIVVVASDPNPVVGVQNTLTLSVSASYVVQIRELAGLGGKVNFLNSTVFDPETGIQVAGSYYDSADLKVFAGSDRVESGGQLDVRQSVSYVLPDFGVEADLVVSIQVIDDRGGLANQSILVPIVPPEAAPEE